MLPRSTVRLFKRVENPCAVLLLGHAMMTNSTSMDKPRGKGLASYLTECGYQCYLIEARGRGECAITAAQGSDWSYDDLMLTDLAGVIDEIKEKHPCQKLFVVGHSLFGHGCLGLLGKYPDTPIEGVVSIAGNIWLPKLENSRRRRVMKRVQLEMISALTFVFGRFPAKKIKFGNEDEAKTYINSFLDWWKKNRWDTLDGEWDYLLGLKNVKVPVLAIAGAGDKLMCHPNSSLSFTSYLTNASLTHLIVGKKESNLSFDPGHMELVTDIRSKPVWATIVSWIEKKVDKEENTHEKINTQANN